jgi:hypothetical protein
MYDSGKIIFGIIVFIALFTAPIWLNISAGKSSEIKPVLKYPAGESTCIKSKDYMRAFHMDMLNTWRDKVVRLNDRLIDFHGKPTEMSLTKTCLKCHSSSADFCDQCHNYLGVTPYCWDCHVKPEEVKKPEPPVQMEPVILNEELKQAPKIEEGKK